MDPEQDDEHPGGWDWPDDGGGDPPHLALGQRWAWSNEDTEFARDCDCPGLPPPPRFALPPPPVPGFTGGVCSTEESTGFSSSAAAVTGGGGGGGPVLSELEYCEMKVFEGPYTQTTIPSIAVIVVCSSLLLVMVLVASLLFWKHKRKMQNFLPCKTSPADLTVGNSVLYEDLTNIRPRNLTNHCATDQTIAPMELLDVKCNNYGGAGFTASVQGGAYPPGSLHHHDNVNHVVTRVPHDDYDMQVYEEVADGKIVGGGGSGSDGGAHYSSLDSDVPEEEDDEEEEEEARGPSGCSSEGEMAEDELSLVEFPPKKAYRENGAGNGVTTGSRPCSGTSSLRGSTGDDLCRDFDSALSDDTIGGGAEPRTTFLPASTNGSASNTERRRRRRARGWNDGGGGGESLRRAGRGGVDRYNGVPVVANGMDDSPVDEDPRLTASCVMLPRGPSGSFARDGASRTYFRPPDVYEDDDDGVAELDYRDGGHHHQHQRHQQQHPPPPPPRDLPRIPSITGLGGRADPNYHSSRSNRDGPGRGSVNHRPHNSSEGHQTWGGPEGGRQRNSDPHERALGEFSTFRPPHHGRGLYGLDVGLLDSDVMGGHYAPVGGPRSSGSDASKGSNTSVERLLPDGGGHYHHHHQPQQHPQRYLVDAAVASPNSAHHRQMAFAGQQPQQHNQQQRSRVKDKQAGFGDHMDSPYGVRTVLT